MTLGEFVKKASGLIEKYGENHPVYIYIDDNDDLDVCETGFEIEDIQSHGYCEEVKEVDGEIVWNEDSYVHQYFEIIPGKVAFCYDDDSYMT